MFVFLLYILLPPVPVSLCLCRTMLSKDKKPDEKVKEVVPPRLETPKMFTAALKMSQQQGLQGSFSALRKTFKTSEGTSEVRQHDSFIYITLLSLPFSVYFLSVIFFCSLESLYFLSVFFCCSLERP